MCTSAVLNTYIDKLLKNPFSLAVPETRYAMGFADYRADLLDKVNTKIPMGKQELIIPSCRLRSRSWITL